jgi:hypothetical protein
MSGLRKRSASKSSHMTTTEDATDDESISRPWNFQVSPFHLSHSPMVLTQNFLPSSPLFLFLAAPVECSFTHTRTSLHTHAHTRTRADIAPYPH